MNYNVFLFDSVVQDTRSQDRARWIMDELTSKHTDVDVFDFEELFDDKATDIFIKHMGKAGYHHTGKVGGGFSFSHPEKLENGGSMVFSRFPISNEKHTIFKDSDKDDAIAAKGGVRISIEKDGIPINIIGTHLQSGRKQKHFDIKQNQMDSLQKIAVDEEINFIVGDFNYRAEGQNINQFFSENNLKALNVTGSSTTNDNLTDGETGNWLDWIVYEESKDYNISGDMVVTKIRKEDGYRIDKKPISSIVNVGKDAEQSITGIFLSKKKRRRRRHKGTHIVFNLSNHHAIKSRISIEEKQKIE